MWSALFDAAIQEDVESCLLLLSLLMDFGNQGVRRYMLTP